jgi:hypothetical protein
MDVDLIRMDPKEAREQLREYRTSLHRRADVEYEAVAKGLEALADGTPILSLSAAIVGGGFDAEMRPRLAVARWDRREVKFDWTPYSNAGAFNAVWDSRGQHLFTGGTVSVDFGRRHGLTTLGADNKRYGKWITAYALVPMIPAGVRLSVPGLAASKRHFILWEVEHWSEQPKTAQPPRDPYLLRHLHGDAYAVVAEWNLTELERLVMAGRRIQA